MTITTLYLIAGLALVGSWAVRRWMTSTYTRWSRVPNRYRVTGAQTAAAILHTNGVRNVRIESVDGALTDHYDSEADVLRLSAPNYGGASVAAMAVSAHEAGHAMQDATDDRWLRLRTRLVPAAAVGTRFGPTALLLGLLFGNVLFIQWGLLLMVAILVFQLVTLPVEINASRRALRNLRRLGLDDPVQDRGTRSVLTAAAFTYVAGAVTSAAYLAALLAGGVGVGFGGGFPA